MCLGTGWGLWDARGSTWYAGDLTQVCPSCARQFSSPSARFLSLEHCQGKARGARVQAEHSSELLGVTLLPRSARLAPGPQGLRCRCEEEGTSASPSPSTGPSGWRPGRSTSTPTWAGTPWAGTQPDGISTASRCNLAAFGSCLWGPASQQGDFCPTRLHHLSWGMGLIARWPGSLGGRPFVDPAQITALPHLLLCLPSKG